MDVRWSDPCVGGVGLRYRIGRAVLVLALVRGRMQCYVINSTWRRGTTPDMRGGLAASSGCLVLDRPPPRARFRWAGNGRRRPHTAAGHSPLWKRPIIPSCPPGEEVRTPRDLCPRRAYVLADMIP
jgi:hypothetical protein